MDELKRSIKELCSCNVMETGTEVGVKLDPKRCVFESCNFDTWDDVAQIEDALTLNYEKVLVRADIKLEKPSMGAEYLSAYLI